MLRDAAHYVDTSEGVKDDDKAESPATFMLKSSGCGVDCGDTLRKGQNVGFKIYIAEIGFERIEKSRSTSRRCIG